MVYVGANDGLLHGFRSGSFSNGNFCEQRRHAQRWLRSARLHAGRGDTERGRRHRRLCQHHRHRHGGGNIHGASPAIDANAAWCSRPSTTPISSTAIISTSMERQAPAICSSAALAHLARGRARARAAPASTRSISPIRTQQFTEGQRREPGHRRVDLGDADLRQRRRLRRESRQHLRHTADHAIPQRHVGRGVRQWLRQHHRRRRHLHHDGQPDQRGARRSTT